MDHGKTWQHGGLAVAPKTANGEPAFQGPFEGEIVELFEKTAAGTPRLMYDVRILTTAANDFCKNGGRMCRVTYTSDDLGETWAEPIPHPEMPDPSCKGSITRWEGHEQRQSQGGNTSTARGTKGRQALFASNVDSYTWRVNQTVYASTDDGNTFDKKLKIDTSGGYAAINTNNANDIVVFYDYSPLCVDGRCYPGKSSDNAGGCSFKLAVLDPTDVLGPSRESP